jgi:hypothetical protein
MKPLSMAPALRGMTGSSPVMTDRDKGLRQRLPTMGSGRNFRDRSLIPQCPIHLSAGRLRGSLGRVQRVGYAVAGVVHLVAGSFGRPFLVAGGDGKGQAGEQGDNQRLTHLNLMIGNGA